MADLLLVLAVICFWAFVAVVVALLVRFTATSRDDEEVSCDLSEAYYSPDGSAEAPTIAHAT